MPDDDDRDAAVQPTPRAGWDEAFQKMAERGDDALLIPDDLEHSFDEEEWDWSRPDRSGWQR